MLGKTVISFCLPFCVYQFYLFLELLSSYSIFSRTYRSREIEGHWKMKGHLEVGPARLRDKLRLAAEWREGMPISATYLLPFYLFLLLLPQLEKEAGEEKKRIYRREKRVESETGKWDLAHHWIKTGTSLEMKQHLARCFSHQEVLVQFCLYGALFVLASILQGCLNF